MKNICLFMAILLVSQSCAFGSQGTRAMEAPRAQAQQTPQVAKVRKEVEKRGAGEKSRVKIKLTSGTEVKGYISKIEEASFTVTDKKSGQAKTISFAEVRKVQGPGLSKGAKIGIAVGVTAGVVAAAAIVVLVSCGGYCTR